MRASGLTRRRAWQGAVAAFVANQAAFPLSAHALPKVQAPGGACVLTRRLSRGLRDGNAVVVTRSWRVTFAEQARGMAIAGEQISVEVEAPSQLAPIAKLEEERSTAGMFPILLASDGIIAAAGYNTSQESFESAVELAQSLFKAKGLTEKDAQQQAEYMKQLQIAGSSLLDELPGDLFFPSTEPYHTVKQVVLPDGTKGEFELTWEASARDDTGLLEEARRKVITRAHSTERRSSEEWFLRAP